MSIGDLRAAAVRAERSDASNDSEWLMGKKREWLFAFPKQLDSFDFGYVLKA